MSTFAETATVDYRLSFADQGKQTSVFRIQQTKENCCLPLVPFFLSCVCVFIFISIFILMLLFQMENGSPGDFP
jgi:hypothetical protein